MGYSEQSKAYRVWIPSIRKIDSTRDLKFVDEPRAQGTFEDFITEDLLRKQGNSTEAEKSSSEPGNVMIPFKSVKTVDHHDAIHQEDDSEAGESLDEEDYEEEVQKAPIAIQNVTVERRGPGRPRIVRTGTRGRPRREYQTPLETVQEDLENVQYAGLAEIPIKEALTGPESNEWIESIREEFRSLVKNETWDIVNRPSDKNVIGCRIVLRN